MLLRKSFPTPASSQVWNINIKHPEKDIMATLWHTVASHKIEYLIMNKTLEAKLLSNKKFTSVTLEKPLGNVKVSHVHCLMEWINIEKMTILTKAIYRFSEIPIRNPIIRLRKIEKQNLNFILLSMTLFLTKYIEYLTKIPAKCTRKLSSSCWSGKSRILLKQYSLLL